MINTDLIPNEIVGYENMKMFVTHLQICFSSTNGGEFPSARLNKEVGAANRERIARTLDELRENGFIPLSINENGRVRWGVIAKSEVQEQFEKDFWKYEKMPIEELMAAGRSGYLQTVKNVTVQNAKDFEMDREQVY